MYCNKKSRSNKRQIKIMLEFMLDRKHLDTGDPILSVTESEWHELKDILKEHGPDRPVEKWKQTWKDLKKNLKKRPTHDCNTCTTDKHGNKSHSDVEMQDADLDTKFANSSIKTLVIKHLQAGTFDTNQSDEAGSDPLMQLKQESPLHTPTLDENDIQDQDLNLEFDGDSDVSARSITPPADSGFPTASDDARREGRNPRNRKREEEIHNLQVAERVWILKTLRAKHDVAQIEKQRAQLERQKARFERTKAQLEMDKAKFERDLAEMKRDKAQMELERARRDHDK